MGTSVRTGLEGSGVGSIWERVGSHGLERTDEKEPQWSWEVAAQWFYVQRRPGWTGKGRR